jgi:hypothetical protein
MHARSVSACSRRVPDRQKLVANHIALVKMIASAIRNNLPAHVELDDLVQAGALGLIDAARKYAIPERASSSKRMPSIAFAGRFSTVFARSTLLPVTPGSGRSRSSR